MKQLGYHFPLALYSDHVAYPFLDFVRVLRIREMRSD